MKSFQEILAKKQEYYGKTEASYEFAAEEYANQYRTGIRRFDEGYVLGIFNTGGIDVLLKELNRLKDIGIEPHEILDIISKKQSEK